MKLHPKNSWNIRRILNCITVVWTLLLLACSRNANTQSSKAGDLIELDIKALQSMPIEDFDFDSNPEIATIEYFQPSDSIIFSIGLPIVGDSWVAMYKDGVFIMDKISGEVMASFERKGGGPEEYVNLLGLGVNYVNKTCHILTSDSPSKIKTYSFDGDFLNELQLKEKIHPSSSTFGIHNDQYFIVEQNSIRGILLGEEDSLVAKPYLLIDRETGEIKPLPIDRADSKICNRYVPQSPDVYAPNMTIDIRDFHGGENKAIISEFSNDTIYAVTDGVVKPIAVKRNWNKDYDTTDLITVMYAGRRYMIFEIVRKTTNHSMETISENESKSGIYTYDFETNEFHRYPNEALFMESNGNLFMLKHIFNLMDAADEGQIKDPKLLEIIKKSNDESNFVWCIYHIAE